MRFTRVFFVVVLAGMLSACSGEQELTTEPSDPPSSTAVSTSSTVPSDSAVPAGSSSSATQEDVADCPQIGFSPNSDDVASDIKVVGVSCQQAEQVVSAVKSTSTLAYESQGFSCTGVENEAEVLRTVNWTCVQGTRQVTFAKT